MKTRPVQPLAVNDSTSAAVAISGEKILEKEKCLAGEECVENQPLI